MSFMFKCFGGSLSNLADRDVGQYAASATSASSKSSREKASLSLGETWGSSKGLSRLSKGVSFFMPATPRPPAPQESVPVELMEPAPSMEPVLENTVVTDPLIRMVSASAFPPGQEWRVASPRDQEHLDQLDESDLKPIAHLGDGGQGNVQLCTLPMTRNRSTATLRAQSSAGSLMEETPGEPTTSESHRANREAEPQLVVAVKEVKTGWNQERELLQLHRCQGCPFIVRLFGFVDDGGPAVKYVMEWAEGGDLGSLLESLKKRRPANSSRLLMAEASARYYVACLLLALEFLHDNNLLHRDVKPSNMLLMSDGTAKLADLGFTVAMDANGCAVGCCGTPGYIAPEVWAYGTAKSKTAYGVPADLWSTGAFIYELLTGDVPAEPDDCLRKGWQPMMNPRFSAQLRDLLHRLLSVKPKHRPQSVGQVMTHPWFSGFDFSALRTGHMKAPFVPSERRSVSGMSIMSSATAATATTSVVDGNSGRLSSSTGTGGHTSRLRNAAGPAVTAAPTAVPALAMSSQLVPQRSAVSTMMNEGSVRGKQEGVRAVMSMDVDSPHSHGEPALGPANTAVPVAGCA